MLKTATYTFALQELAVIKQSISLRRFIYKILVVSFAPAPCMYLTTGDNTRDELLFVHRILRF